MRRLFEGFGRAEVEMIGDSRIVPGAMLKLEKLDDAVDGTYRVDHARHEFSKQGYFMRLKAVRVGKKKPPRPARPAPAQLAGTAWLEFELLDEWGRPVPEERYQVMSAVGRVLRSGRLDNRGCARLTGLEPGSYTVFFPESYAMNVSEFEHA